VRGSGGVEATCMIAKTFVESAMAAAEQFPDGRATEALRAAPASLLETVLSPTA
jgi:geranylgeranyl pyrophosphate synthase